MVRSRLAPTPSGYLHAGNALNFLLTEALVERAGGRLHLRIDDLDGARVRPAYLANIFDTLHWLGIRWDSGPHNVADFQAHYSQHLRLDRYAALLAALVARPGLVYACTCSRAQVAATTGPNGPNGQYAGTCRDKHLPLTTANAVWRVRVPPEATVQFTDGFLGSRTLDVAELVGDFVIRKKDGLPAYQTASLADDIADGITLIVRGEDLLPSTAAQLWLAAQAGSGWAAFADVRFYHHPLLLDSAGRKLSKSQQTPLDRGALHDAALTPAALRGLAAQWLAEAT
ncbi:MAG: tRNA glutamyl-Q synthetase [Hymenobacteraceae bacterium]|nr:tRNA glutamyl-Q synthetase [Hymenobacteraceae bacterium]